MPINLGDIPTNFPLRNGKIQIKRGGADVVYNVSAANNGQKIIDNAGGNMEIYYAAVTPCWWIVSSNIMAHGYPDGVTWRRWDHAIRISPADANGITLGHQCPHQVYDNSTIEWRTVAATVAFRLAAGVTYTAYLTSEYTSAGTVQIHTGPQWCRIVGRVVSEGVL